MFSEALEVVPTSGHELRPSATADGSRMFNDSTNRPI